MLNPEIEIKSLADEFARLGRARIKRVLQFGAAEQLYECLHKQVPWSLAFRTASGSRTLPERDFAAMPEDDVNRLLDEIRALARTEFQFLYNSYMMVTAYKENRDPELLLHRLLEFLNSPTWLDFMRSITGIETIRKADAQATRYLPGHFLKFHNDHEPEEKRLAAYVLNLSRNWQADWGGLLHFMDDDGKITHTSVPRFNCLTVFKVPANHFVSEVAPFARTPRYAITGWLKE